MNRNRHRTAFTLIELMLVLLILAVLAAVVVPKFAGRSEQARITAAKADISMLDGQLDLFEHDCGRYPSNDEGLGALIGAPGSVQNWHGPYVKRNEIPKDPWGNPYIYKYPGSRNPNGVDLASMGPDGREGNDDITN
jgi:general secretion pathway protein G